MIDSTILKNILIGLILALVAIQPYRNFGSLRDDYGQMIKENLISLLVIGMAVFVYQLIVGGTGG